MTLVIITLIVAAALSLPGGLFMVYFVSEPRARWVALFGGIVGAVAVALGIYYYVQASNVGIDAISFFVGAFFGCSIGVFLGALVMNFLVGLGGRGRDISSLEL